MRKEKPSFSLAEEEGGERNDDRESPLTSL